MKFLNGGYTRVKRTFHIRPRRNRLGDIRANQKLDPMLTVFGLLLWGEEKPGETETATLTRPCSTTRLEIGPTEWCACIFLFHLKSTFSDKSIFYPHSPTTYGQIAVSIPSPNPSPTFPSNPYSNPPPRNYNQINIHIPETHIQHTFSFFGPLPRHCVGVRVFFPNQLDHGRDVGVKIIGIGLPVLEILTFSCGYLRYILMVGGVSGGKGGKEGFPPGSGYWSVVVVTYGVDFSKKTAMWNLVGKWR